MTDDERAQAYEDNYWAEWDGRDSVIAAAVETWDDSTSDLFIAALNQAVATRVEERGETNAAILEG